MRYTACRPSSPPSLCHAAFARRVPRTERRSAEQRVRQLRVECSRYLLLSAAAPFYAQRRKESQVRAHPRKVSAAVQPQPFARDSRDTATILPTSHAWSDRRRFSNHDATKTPPCHALLPTSASCRAVARRACVPLIHAHMRAAFVPPFRHVSTIFPASRAVIPLPAATFFAARR